MTFTLSKSIIFSRKNYEIAGGIAEELLYNIKTVTSFVNLDYEIKRFGNLIDKVETSDKKEFLFPDYHFWNLFLIFIGTSLLLEINKG